VIRVVIAAKRLPIGAFMGGFKFICFRQHVELQEQIFLV
jgi:hypothetical protein